jgi:HEAT repeat protein
VKRSFLLTQVLLLLAAVHAGAQEPQAGTSLRWFAYVAPAADPADDRAYAAYRRGYGYIMEERWVEARKTLDELQKLFPQSPYAEDAAYWSAYALAQTDRRKAMTAYALFLERFPRSRYAEDATADFAVLRATEGPRARVDSAAMRLSEVSQVLIIQERGIRSLEFAVRRMHRALRFTTSGGLVTLNEGFPDATADLDRETRVQLEALAAIGETRGDEQTFRALRELARDPRRPPQVRSVALRSLSRFSRFDPLPVLVDAARSDSNWSVQETAILSIGQVPGEPEKAMESLAMLYGQFPRVDAQRRLAVIDAAASLGTSRALTFLVQVARTTPDTVLQTTAIDNIAAAGRDKHRNVELLIGLYRSLPREHRLARETALYGVAEMGTDRAVDFLVQVARDSSEDDLRRDAVIYLGTIGGTKARNALYEILRSP